MIKINLLDWRAALRERRRKQFVALFVVGLLAAIAVVGLGYVLMTNQVSYQQQRNEYLRQQIAEVDQKIKEIQELEKVKANLLARMRVIEELQSSRAATVHFFDDIVNTLPDGITLTLIKQVGSLVNIEGLAESNGRVSAYIKNLDASPWFEAPKLIVIKTSEKNKQRESVFTLQVTNLTKGKVDEPEVAPAAEVPKGTAGSNALGALGSDPLPPAPSAAGAVPAPAPGSVGADAKAMMDSAAAKARANGASSAEKAEKAGVIP
jgi:type IV pilus assembly protein PilN